MFLTYFFLFSTNCESIVIVCLLTRSAEARARRPEFQDDSEAFDQPPAFTHKPRSLHNLVEGKNAHFEAKVTPITDPNLSIEWFKDGRPITVGSRCDPSLLADPVS